jgi:hypothetical protein
VIDDVNETGTGHSQKFFDLPLLITIPPLVPNHHFAKAPTRRHVVFNLKNSPLASAWLMK